MLFIIVQKVTRLLVILKKHYQQLKKSTVCKKYGLPFISGLDLDIVETSANIQFSKIHCFLKLQNKLRDQEKWVLVLDSYYIKVSIILHQLERTVFFLDEKYQYSYKRFGGVFYLVQRFSEKKISSSNYSLENRRYTLKDLGSALDKGLITESHQ